MLTLRMRDVADIQACVAPPEYDQRTYAAPAVVKLRVCEYVPRLPTATAATLCHRPVFVRRSCSSTLTPCMFGVDVPLTVNFAPWLAPLGALLPSLGMTLISGPGVVTP